MEIDLQKVTVGYTHSGGFHADDVFSAALLRLINPEIKFLRVNSVPDNTENAIVFDIGGGEFDHHQTDFPVRSNGVPYAAFGLLWREFGELLTDKDSVQNIDDSFVSYIDSADNGIGTDTLSFAIAAMNPMWNEEQNYNENFEQAVDFALTILKRIIKRENSKKEAYNEIMQALNKSSDGIVILKRFAPYEELLVPTETKFVIYPSNRGGYNIEAIQQEPHTKTKKIPFPKSWCICSDEELPALTGISSFRFCHKNGFLAACETLNDAVKIAKYAINDFQKSGNNAN